MHLKQIIVISFTAVLVLASFKGENTYFVIEKKDVALEIPKGFPKPSYDFRNNELRPDVFVLGRYLFYDGILSKDSTISCATCHIRIAAFAHFDHKLSHGINGLIGTRNVPSLQNLIWKDALMADGGVNNLEVQPISPITNKVEMDETMANVIAKLQRSSFYRNAFFKAFDDTLINSQRMLKALAQFTGLMISSDSRYDKFIRKEDTLSTMEMKGLNTFRQKCASCHIEPLFTDNSFSNNGLKPDTALNDIGRGKISGNEDDYYKFKVPSLRNIEMSYPYMHDGRFRNLKDVLNHYADPKNFYGKSDKRLKNIGKLNDEDKTALYAFLLTLTDKSFIYDRRFVDPFTQ
jgi:cytochrome c peroxidase